MSDHTYETSSMPSSVSSSVSSSGPSAIPTAATPLPSREKPIFTPMKPRSRGISLNLAVSPASSTNSPVAITSNGGAGSTPNGSNGNQPHHRRTLSNTGGSCALPDLPESPSPAVERQPTQPAIEVPLPDIDKLNTMDIDEQLRLLALKEMHVVEIKDEMAKLASKLKQNEVELHTLRQVIQRSLYKEIGSGSGVLSTASTSNPDRTKPSLTRSSTDLTPNPHDAAVLATTQRRRRTISLGGNAQAPVIPQLPKKQENQPTRPENQDRDPEIALPLGDASSSSNRGSSLWSNFSKPLNLIQQFDTMLQHEFEKSLEPAPERHQSVQPLPISPNKETEPMEEGDDETYEKKIQNVSNSIWSFVNDVRLNVLHTLGDDNEIAFTGEGEFVVPLLRELERILPQDGGNGGYGETLEGEMIELKMDKEHAELSRVMKLGKTHTE